MRMDCQDDDYVTGDHPIFSFTQTLCSFVPINQHSQNFHSTKTGHLSHDNSPAS